MRRLPALVLGSVVAATVAAFFVTQHLKVSTPLLAGFPAPDPGAINPVSGGTCGGVDHRVTRLSFYLLNRSDDVDVYVIDQSGSVIDTIASGRHMRRGVRIPDGEFVWNGRQTDGHLAPDGTYFFKVALVHQGRTVVISNAAGPEPVTLESGRPAPVVTSVSHGVIPQGTHATVRVDYRGDDQLGGYLNLYRTDVPGPPRAVSGFGLPGGAHNVTWDGRIQAHAAPAGTYLVGLTVIDAACTTGTFPPRMPPAPGSTPHAGITVRYLAAQPPLEPAAAGASAAVRVDSARGAYTWALARQGAPRPAATGSAASGPGSPGGSAASQLSVPLPPRSAGLYELTLRSSAATAAVPIVASGTAPQPVLVVLPALTWQGLNPVDDNGDGIPNTLSGGDPVALARPFAGGLPAGFGDEAALLAYLDAAHRGYDLTTDLGLIEGVGPPLGGHRAVVLGGSERWLPKSLLSALRSYVQGGGRVLSLGIDSLRRSIVIRGGRARDPSAPARTDALGATVGAQIVGNQDPITAITDDAGLLQGPAATLSGFSSFEPLSVASASVLFAAGVDSSRYAVLGYRLGRGTVIDIALEGFGSSLAHNASARALLDAVWKALNGSVPFGA